ncbi:MAG TPA: hypothetical protein VFS33_08030 [Gemmatimonadales bacterium]|nr:hypothetical protein [Gemmatimonadales bacterium]
MRTVAVTLLLLTLAALPVCAQNVCRPPDNSNEANTLAAMSVPIAFAPLDAPRPARPGAIQVALEGTYIPQIDSVTRTPTICRPGKGAEQTQLLVAFPRPRVLIGLPGGLQFEGAWVPPITINSVKANLGSAALSRGFPLGRGNTVLGIRAHATFGVVNAPITCPADQLANPASECFQGTQSDDRYHPNIFGAEGTLGWAMAGGQLHPYIGGGVNVLHPRFQVNFVNRFGDLDNTRVEVNLTRGVVFGGLAWRVAPGWGVSAEIYAQPADAVTGRLALGYAIR